MTYPTKLEAALAHARAGFPVFPLIPNGKTPLLPTNWREIATTDESVIGQWWAQTPDANIAITTDRLLVVDIDPRKGGDKTFVSFCNKHRLLDEELPKTRRAETWSGGAHVVYRLPHDITVKGGADKLGPGLDVKSWGGYIVASGSTIDGKAYKWGNERNIAEAPQWLIDLCRQATHKSASAGQRLIEEDDVAIARAQHWLDNHARDAFEGAIDDTAFIVAARLYDEGVSRETCREMLAGWSFDHCFPPMAQADIDRVSASAERNRSSAIGVKHPDLPVFEPVELKPTPTETGIPTSKPRLYYVPFATGANSALTVAAEPLIKGLLDRGAMSVWYGESNSGKTFVVLDASWHVAAGQTYAGMRVRQGAVLYLAPEGGRGIYKRLAALRQSRPDFPDIPLYVVPCPVNLLRGDADTKPLVEMVRELEATKGQKVELIVVDTLSRALSGGDENSSVDMGALVRNFDALRTAADVHLAIVHHTGKDKARGARGHSLLRAATDTEIEIADRTVTPTKQRDMEGDKPLTFRLLPVRLGVDADGDPVTSCVLEIRQMSHGERHQIPVPPLVFEYKKHLLSYIAKIYDKTEEDVYSQPFTTEDGREANRHFIDVGLLKGKTTDAALEARYRRIATLLKEYGHLKNHLHGQWLLIKPTTDIKPTLSDISTGHKPTDTDTTLEGCRVSVDPMLDFA